MEFETHTSLSFSKLDHTFTQHFTRAKSTVSRCRMMATNLSNFLLSGQSLLLMTTSGLFAASMHGAVHASCSSTALPYAQVRPGFFQRQVSGSACGCAHVLAPVRMTPEQGSQWVVAVILCGRATSWLQSKPNLTCCSGSAHESSAAAIQNISLSCI